jgi:acetylornithine/succinyldiaminopimelate/putrescine aminotransferase
MFTDRQLFFQFLAQTSDLPLAIEIKGADGIYLYGADNKRYVDLISGVSVSNAGHNNAAILNALTDQLKSYTHLMVYGEFIQSPQVQYAIYLTSLLPAKLNNVYFVNSGSEAIEGAMKLAKRYTGRTEIIAFKNAYHGSSQGALSILGNEVMKQSFRPLLPDIRLLKFNDETDLKNITTNAACVVMELIQSEAGIILPQDNFILKVAKRCKETSTLLVFDEVQTGICRTGKNFAFEHYGVVPDVLVLAKALGGGLPLGAFVASKDLMQCLTHNPVLGHITTFGGHPLSCTAGLAAFQFLNEKRILSEIDSKANLFYKLLIAHNNVKEIRYKGLLMAVELGDPNKLHAFIKLGLEKGFVSDWFLFCDTAFRVSPPLIISEEEIRATCELILQVLDEI